jgi:hypothetical protein
MRGGRRLLRIPAHEGLTQAERGASAHRHQIMAGILTAESGILPPGLALEWRRTAIPPSMMPGSTAGRMPAVTGQGGGGQEMHSGGTSGQRAENSRTTQNPICAPEAGWPPAAPEGQNASPGGLWPGNPSIESSEDSGFGPSRGRFSARMKFSSPGMLTAEREPTENMSISFALSD